MGFFDFLGGGPERVLRKHAERVANKRAQAPDRAESIRYLAGLRSAAAVEALLPRFGFAVDPSIIDQEEKEEAFEAIVAAGPEAALDPVRDYFRRAATISWPLKVLGHLLTPEEVVDEILAVIVDLDIEYLRDPERKQQLLAALETFRSPMIAEAVLRFLEDVNETARYHAVGALLEQDPSDAVDAALLQRITADDSMRVRARIVAGLADRKLVVPPEARDAIKKALPTGYALAADGTLRRPS